MLKENKEVKAMELSERKQKILKAIVDLYIRSAEPVPGGSLRPFQQRRLR